MTDEDKYRQASEGDDYEVRFAADFSPPPSRPEAKAESKTEPERKPEPDKSS